MNGISVKLNGQYDRFSLDVDFQLPLKGVSALFGPSGCGKTTILRGIAGLEKHVGQIKLGEEIWQDNNTFTPPHKRAVGYVFQEASLFPHMSVRQNLLYGASAPVDEEKLAEVSGFLRIEDFLKESTINLSGGERQRVAIGRALLSQPEILLMDEPLSALDQASKEAIIPYLEDLSNNLSIPILYVSHDHKEIERLADHIVMLEAGRVQAQGDLVEILTDSSLPLAKAREASTIVTGVVNRYDPENDVTHLAIEGGEFLIPGMIDSNKKFCRLRIAASDVSLSLEPPSKTTIINILPIKVEEVAPLTHGQYNILCSIGGNNGAKILARISKKSMNSFDFKIGQTAYAQVKGVSMIRPI